MFTKKKLSILEMDCRLLDLSYGIDRKFFKLIFKSNKIIVIKNWFKSASGD